MIKNNSPVHYLTESSDIYKEYCYKINSLLIKRMIKTFF